MWDGLQSAATVAQMVGFDVGGLISMIGQAARTAKQNTKDCEHLARRVGLLADLVPRLQHDPEARRAAAGLDGTLREAHALVVSCQRRGFASHLFSASRMSERFRDVERKIDDYLSVVPVIGYIGIARRLDYGGGSGGGGGGTINHHHTTTTTSRSLLLEDQSRGAEEFRLAEIVVATNNFAVVLSDDADTGTKVYKGRLIQQSGGAEVAVKRLNTRRRGGGAEDAFFAEQQILSPLRHDHIVRLLGTCADDGERILVTEYMPNGSLHDHLHGCRLRLSSSPVTASWKTRIQVLLGAARAVEHLHCHAMPLVIHGNVASSNILLDAAWAPRLSGFGASVWRAAGVDSQAVDNKHFVAGGATADPEYCSTGRIRTASDVYGIGVVMLEVLTGQPPAVSVWDDEAKRSVVTMTLAAFALPSIEAGRIGDVLDRRPAATWQQQPLLQALQMVGDTAARCLCLHGDNRPAISEVVANLQHAQRLI